MKKIFSIIALAFVYTSINAQYVEDAILFSSDQILGNAKNQGMSGATGALGGDISGASELNPAGIALSEYINLSITGGLNTNATKSQLEDARQSDSDTFLNFPQVGATFVFKTSNENQPWKGFAFGVNHQKTGYFERSYFVPPPSNDINRIREVTENNQTTEVETTYIGTSVDLEGRASKLSFTLGANYKNILYLGFGINWNAVTFDNIATLEEVDNSIDEVIDPPFIVDEYYKTGNGVSLSIGAIVQPTEQIRLGLSYQSPVWYSFEEEFDNEEGESVVFESDLRNPAKITASGAFTIQDLVSIGLDYQFTQYKDIRYSPSGEFIDINSLFDQDIKNTSGIRIGGELKLEEWFIRAGYKWEESPTGSIQNFQELNPRIVSNLKGNLNQYSFGVGYKFPSGFQIDVAYTKRNQERQLAIYNDNEVPLADVDYSDSNVSVSLNWRL